MILGALNLDLSLDFLKKFTYSEDNEDLIIDSDYDHSTIWELGSKIVFLQMAYNEDPD